MKTFKVLTRIINFIFWIFLPAIMAISLLVYWKVVAEPQLRADAENNSIIWAQSNEHRITTALGLYAQDSPDRSVKQVIKSLDTILLFKEQKTGVRFILGVKLEMDYDVINAKHGELDIARGETSCDECFVTRIPLYTAIEKELTGFATFCVNCEFYRRLKDDMKSKLLKLSGVIFAFLIAAWGILTVKTGSIWKAENQIREQRAKLAGTERLAALGEMATGIAHEINQPLAIISIFTDDLKDSFDTKDSEIFNDTIEKIVEQINRAGTIIGNMQNFVRTPSETLEPVDIKVLINSALSFFNERFRLHLINFTISFADDLPEDMIIPQHFQQIVANLLSNAYYAVEKKSQKAGTEYQKKVEIRLFHDPAKKVLVFELQDNGTGMEKEVRDRCLDPFYTTKDTGEGTGLGLFIINRIAKEYKMKMEIESIEGQGTTFRISVPVS